jgi:hypothetical protein
MLRLLIAGLVVNFATFAAAGQFGGGDFRGFGGHGSFLGLGGPFGFGDGFGFGHHHGLGFGFGLGLGFFDAERLQMRFEDRFNELMMEYETGVTDIMDFYNSEEYDEIVDDTEKLSFRYDLFVSGVERGIDRIDTFIGFANDELTFFDDLLADFQADEDLSPERLERIETWIGRITDRIDMKIDHLTETQATLETNLPTYLGFQTHIDTFLTEIIDAGGTTEANVAALPLGSVAALSAESPSVASHEATAAFRDDQPSSASTSAVPEPSTQLLAALVLGGMAILRQRRVGHRAE